MSKKGQTFGSAGAHRIENQGQQCLHVTTTEGREHTTTIQIGDVIQPLMSVTQVCDNGHFVLFTSEGGSVYNLYDATWSDFDRWRDIYTMDWYLTAEDANGQHRKLPHQRESSGGILKTFKDIVTGGPGFTRQG